MKPQGSPQRWPRLVSGVMAGLVAACVGLTGCAGASLFSPMGAAQPLFADRALSAEQARQQLIPGVSTQADVLALLGPATVIRFDSGHTVWVYRTTRARASDPGAEFIVLFTPSGVVKKTRQRSANGQAEG